MWWWRRKTKQKNLLVVERASLLSSSYHVQFSRQESVNLNHDYKLSTMDNDSGRKLIVHAYYTAQ